MVNSGGQREGATKCGKNGGRDARPKRQVTSIRPIGSLEQEQRAQTERPNDPDGLFPHHESPIILRGVRLAMRGAITAAALADRTVVKPAGAVRKQ